MSKRKNPEKAVAEKHRQSMMRRSMLAPEVVNLASRRYRQFTMGTMPLAEEMGLTMFSPVEDGAEAPVFSEAEEIRQMAALAWAHDEEHDLQTEVLPSIVDGTWKEKARAYLMLHFRPGEFFALAAHMRDFQQQVREAKVIVTRATGAPLESSGE